MPRIILYMWFSFLANHIQAQLRQHYLFSNITAKSGLASNHVNSIVQDHEGYLWIGTLNGLQRYDGIRFITFHHNPADSRSIAHNHITFLYVDKKKNLWVIFDNGKIGKFDTKKFIFTETKIRVPDDKILTAEREITEDAEGNLFLAFSHYMLTIYDQSANEFAEAPHLFPTPPGWKITGFNIEPATKKYWMSSDSGLAVYNRSTKHLNYRNHNIDKEPAIESFKELKDMYSLFTDSKQRLWFCTWPSKEGPRVYCFDNRQQALLLPGISLKPAFNYYHEPRTFLEHFNGSIWLYGTGILALFDEKTKAFLNTGIDVELKKTVLNDRINCVFQDRENNLWACTHNNGIYQFNPSAQLFKSFDHPNLVTNLPGNGGVLSFVEEEDKTFLYSAWSDGLFRCDTNFKHIPIKIKGLPEKNLLTAWDMCKRTDGTVWMGLEDGHLIVYNPASKSAKQFQPAIFQNKTIRQVVEDKKGNMWLGSNNLGVFKWVKDSTLGNIENGFTRLSAIPKTMIEKLYLDKKGILWVCTLTDGVYKIDTEKSAVLRHYTDKGTQGKRLLNKAASDAFQYDDTTMIFASGGLNILNTKTDSFHYVTLMEGLPSENISAIERDNDGELWLALIMGVCRVNLQQKTFSYFDRSDGIANDNFNISAAIRLSNGYILFGAGNDYTAFNPADFKMKTVPPDVQITGFTVNNRSLQTDSLLALKKVNLNYHDNSVIIYFASLRYLQQNKLTYYYMMEGVNKDWVKCGNNLQADYSHLSPGKYTFKVRCQNADGVPSKNITQFTIAISTPFWKSWWLYILIALGLGILFYRYDKERMQRKAAIQKMRSDIGRNLADEVNMALNNINILSEMARIKADKEPQKSKEYIEQIHSKSNNMILALEDMLWSLSPENDSMKKTVERMKEYIDELQNSHGVKIELRVDKKVAELALNMKLRHEALLVFKEGIKNLVQCGTKHCDIQIGLSKNNLLFTMQFQNSFCNMQQLHQMLHRHDLVKHLKSINALIDVEVHKTNSILVLHIPVN
ncbi:MAG: two-component regulator propeller domain-containing protein [Ferruginibacter sp.]